MLGGGLTYSWAYDEICSDPENHFELVQVTSGQSTTRCAPAIAQDREPLLFWTWDLAPVALFMGLPVLIAGAHQLGQAILRSPGGRA